MPHRTGRTPGPTVQKRVQKQAHCSLAVLSYFDSGDCIADISRFTTPRLHRYPALTIVCGRPSFARVDGRKGWLAHGVSQSEVGWVISLIGETGWTTRPEKTDGSARSVGVWNCESSDRIRGCDGACIHVTGFLAKSRWLEHNQNRSLFNSVPTFCRQFLAMG